MKNPCLFLLYTLCYPPTACSNYSAPAAPTSLEYSTRNSACAYPTLQQYSAPEQPVEGSSMLPCWLFFCRFVLCRSTQLVDDLVWGSFPQPVLLKIIKLSRAGCTSYPDLLFPLSPP